MGKRATSRPTTRKKVTGNTRNPVRVPAKKKPEAPDLRAVFSSASGTYLRSGKKASPQSSSVNFKKRPAGQAKARKALRFATSTAAPVPKRQDSTQKSKSTTQKVKASTAPRTKTKKHKTRPKTARSVAPVPKRKASSGGFDLRGMFSSGGTQKVTATAAPRKQISGSTVKKVRSPMKSPATVKLKSRAQASSKPAQRAAPAPKREVSSGGLNLRGLFSSNGTSNAKAATAPRKQISGSAVKKAPSPVKAAATAKLKSRARLAQSPHSVPRRPRNARPPPVASTFRRCCMCTLA